jgi:glycosyltransferase involved in cell wall biosynthesis
VVLSSRSESFGNVVAEAVASDVPVVVTEGCGVASLVRNRVGLVSEQSAEKFREALRQVLEDRTLYATFKVNCGRVKQEFSWDGPIDMLEKTYGEILTESRG